MVRLLLVEDDAALRETIAGYLVHAGYQVSVAADVATALTVYTEEPAGVDVVLLDLMLPDGSGLELAKRLRTLRRDLPLIMVTARGQEHERVQGLQYGADDYLVKPFSLRELDLRIRSVLRRAAPPEAQLTSIVRDGDLEVDLPARRARRGDQDLALTSREFDLLAFLMQHPQVMFSRQELIQQVWGWSAGDDSTVTVHVRRLREKVEDDPKRPTRLVTVFGRGYRWDAASPSVLEA